MPSLFADTHNVIAILEKSDASEGFDQILDFLSGSYIHYALTVSPHIYISCIKQFWNTVVVKRMGDVTRLQALVDKKKIVISEDVIREILQLNDAEGVVCLPNDEIFAGLAQMGYEKPSTKLTFYKAFFSKEIADDVPQPTSPLPPSLIIPPTPPHPSPRTSPSQAAEGTSILIQQVLDKYSALVHRVEGLESANTAQQLEILKLKASVKKLERLNKVKSSKLKRLKKVGTSQRIESSEDEGNVFNQGRISVDIDEGIELVDDQEKDAQVKGRQADTQAEIYKIDLDHTSKVLSMQEDSKVQEVVEVVNAAKLITEVVTAATQDIPAAKSVVAAVSTPASTAKPKVLKVVPAALTVSTRKRKGVVIRDPKEELHDDTPTETQFTKDKGKGILVEDPKPIKKKDQIAMDAEYARKLQEEEYIRRYHGYKKKPQSESEARKNMIDYLKNTEEEMKKEEEEIIKSINETPAQKAAKRRRLYEQAKEAEDLKKQLEHMFGKTDAQDVLWRSQLTEHGQALVKSWKLEDLEDLWKIVKARFSTSKPTNWTDDYLLVTLKHMFGKTDAQDVLWRSQLTEHGQALVKSWKLLTSCGVHMINFTTTMFVLLVEKKYPLSRFTLEHLVNVAKLQVEEESEMSLELLRFTRQQLLEYQQE
nr:hypothetical protein [Tanacetum cinerariifolium]